MSISPAILNALKALDPAETWTSTSGPRITSSKGVSYYAKYGSVRDWEQWYGEAESLKAMDFAAPGLCPKLIAFGEYPSSSRRPYMISEYKDLGGLSGTSAVALAKRMALELHNPIKSQKEAQGRFGFGCPTYCGVTRFENGWFDSWEDCFAAMMRTLVDGIRAKGRSFEEVVCLGDETIQE